MLSLPVCYPVRLMNTLADFKRRLVPGLAVTAEFPGTIIRGNLGDTVLPGKTVTRKVHSVTPGKVVWTNAEGGPGSSLHWPKADCLTFGPNGDTVSVADEPGKTPFVTYRF